jgi:hypothetical protein
MLAGHEHTNQVRIQLKNSLRIDRLNLGAALQFCALMCVASNLLWIARIPVSKLRKLHPWNNFSTYSKHLLSTQCGGTSDRQHSLQNYVRQLYSNKI